MAKTDIMFVLITGDGKAYDKSFKRNDIIEFNMKYTLGNSTVEFTNDTGVVSVTRFNSKGKKVYSQELPENKSYLIAPLFVQELAQSPKEMRTLYNRLKTTIGAPFFKIESHDSMVQPFSVRLHTWIDKGFKYRFIIKINESKINTSISNVIYKLINDAASRDLLTVLRYYDALNNNGLVMTIDDEFFDHVDYIIANQKVQIAQ